MRKTLSSVPLRILVVVGVCVVVLRGDGKAIGA